jgi:hypothetical protein
MPLMLESVKRYMPEYRLVQLTDMDTECLNGVDEVIRRARPDAPIFVFRTEHFAHCPYSEWLALDTDVIVRQAVDDVWARAFDVALTTRRAGPCWDPNGLDVSRFMPFNTGVIFSRQPKFWHKCSERMVPPYEGEWWSDQLAVGAVAESKQFRVLVLPGDEFNWTPKTKDEQSDARIWHYKGNRKEWMHA